MEFDVYDLRTALRSLTAVSFTDKQPDGQEEISLTLHLDNEAFPTFTLTLYRYDGENCLAAVDGEPAALVSRAQTVDLVEAVRARSTGLPRIISPMFRLTSGTTTRSPRFRTWA